MKVVMGILAGGIGAAFALAFALDFFLDTSLKRPGEIETRLGLPLFLSIPHLAINGNSKPRALNAIKTRLLPQRAGPSDTPDADTHHAPRTTGPTTPNSEPSSLDPQGSSITDHASRITHHESPTNPLIHQSINPSIHQSTAPPLVPQPSPLVPQPPTLNPQPSLGPFCETLRDRLITYFEVQNLTHKPKLVALTSCAEGSGVSTLAAGLAASLSETGDGNVLLVDMNQQSGAAHQFFKGNLAYSLDDALEAETRDNTLVQDNLYVVSEASNGSKLPSVLPKRFKGLVPRLKASDYDYIIFDMPPVSQISLTPRLARFMDSVLLVVESEKTDREVVKRASAMLTEHKANVGIVLNKTHTYVPKRLQQEL